MASCKRGGKRSRASGPHTIQVAWPGGYEAAPLNFLINQVYHKNTLWVSDSGLCEMLTALIQERAPTQAVPLDTDIDTTPTYDTINRTWTAQWRDETTGSISETSVIVDKRRRTTKGHEPMTPETFLKRKLQARSRLKRQAAQMGCTTMSESDDETTKNSEGVHLDQHSGLHGGA